MIKITHQFSDGILVLYGLNPDLCRKVSVAVRGKGQEPNLTLLWAYEAKEKLINFLVSAAIKHSFKGQNTQKPCDVPILSHPEPIQMVAYIFQSIVMGRSNPYFLGLMIFFFQKFHEITDKKWKNKETFRSLSWAD